MRAQTGVVVEAFLRTIYEAKDDWSQLIFGDWLQERGDPLGELIAHGFRLQILAVQLGDGGDGGGGYGGGYGDGDGYGYGGYGGGGYGYGGYGGGDGGYGDGGGDGYGGKQKQPVLGEGLIMRDGFQIISVVSGYSPYVLAGWAEIRGLDVVMRNCVVLRRFGQDKQLAQLAVEGPAKDTSVLDMSSEETFWRPLISRAIPANPLKWAKHCPKPTEVEEEVVGK